MRFDIVVEHVAGTFLFSAETDRGRDWLKSRRFAPPFTRIGQAVEAPEARPAKDLADAAIADGLDVQL